MIYFDNGSTTKISPEVIETYVKTSELIFGNPSSLHELGEKASQLLQNSRQQIANLLNVKANEIYFTSGGTEGDNWVVKGTAFEKRGFGKQIIVSDIEHPAVTESVAQLQEFGFTVDFAPVDSAGRIDLQAFKKLLHKDTILVTIMAVNNEVGSKQPIPEISEILADYPKVHFHVDAVQAIGKLNLAEYLTDRVDFATFSAHKFHGPRGVGFIYLKSGKRISSLISGGGQENNQRSGTENLPAIVGMAKALRKICENQEQKVDKITKLRNKLFESLSQYEKVLLFSKNDESSAPHILAFGIKGVRGEVLVHALAKEQIYLSTTSACSSRKKNISGTLKSMKIPAVTAQSAVRISLDETNNESEVAEFIRIFRNIYHKLSKIS